MLLGLRNFRRERDLVARRRPVRDGACGRQQQRSQSLERNSATDSLEAPRSDRIAEFKAREAANLFWLERIFETAKSAKAAGVFLAIQANPNFELPAQDQRRAGFNSFLDKLTSLAVQFAKPVVLAHGDAHYFRIDKPLRAQTAGGARQTLENFTRLEAFGSPNAHWVRVSVDANDPNVFLIEQRIVPENKFPR